MHALLDQLRNPLTRERDSRDRTRLSQAFPVLQTCSEPQFLALRRYLDGCPERFFDTTAFEIYLGWLQKRDNKDIATLKAYLLQFGTEINRALLFLREINSEDWHDRLLNGADEYELVRFIDKHVHPTYLRLTEAVLTPLTRPVAHFSRIDRGKGTDGLDVWSVMQELQTGPADALVRPYQHIIRNGVAHGGITFLQNKIRYRDKKGNEETFDTRCVVRLFDDLLDTCNGLSAALKVFFLVERDRGYDPPRELLVEELQEVTSTPWWSIEGCVEAEIAGKSQLIVYARPESRHYAKVHWSTIQSGILAEYFAPGYDRYFLSLRSRKAWPGWAAFDGEKLRILRETQVNDLSQYRGIVEDDLVFFVPRRAMSALLGKVDTLLTSFQIAMPAAMQQMRDSLGVPRIVCRSSAVHRNFWGAVLNAEIVLADLDDQSAISVVRTHRRRIVKAALKQARREHRWCGAAYLPLGYANVAVFKKDYRRRRLSGFGLANDLVCTVRFQRLRRIKSPDIIGSSVEVMGKWRIAWNRAWLETSGQQLA